MLETLKYLFDKSPEVSLGQVKTVGSISEKGVAVELTVLPEGYEVVALGIFPKGICAEISVGDLMIVYFPDSDTEAAFAFGFIAGETRELHPRISDGDFCVGGISGKKTNVSSSERVNLGRGGETEESEPLVLGDILKTYLTALSQQITLLNTYLTTLTASVTAIDAAVNSGAQAGPLGTLATNLSTQASQITTEKTQYLDTESTNIVSQIAYTER